MSESEANKAEVKDTIKNAAPKKFGKGQLLASSRFRREEKYFLDAILEADKEYTIDEARKLLDKEMRRKVK